MKKKRRSIEVDVSGDDLRINSRGKRVNTDMPEEERRRVSAGKKKQKLRSKAEQKDELLRKRKDEEDAKLGVKKRKRRKKYKEEEEAPRKKKRRKKTVGELLDKGKTEKARRKLDRLTSKAMVIADRNEVEGGDLVVSSNRPSSEQDFLDEYQHIFSTLGNIIRKLELRMAEGENVSSKDVYALMTMYSQMRETMADMRSIKDMTDQAEDLAANVFDPAAKSAGEALVNLYFKISTQVRQTVDDPKTVETLLNHIKEEVGQQAVDLQASLSRSRQRILEVMNGG